MLKDRETESNIDEGKERESSRKGRKRGRLSGGGGGGGGARWRE